MTLENVEKVGNGIAQAALTSVKRQGVTPNYVVRRIIDRMGYTPHRKYVFYNVANLDVAIKAADMAIDDVREAGEEFMGGDLLGTRWTLALNLLQVDGVNGHPAFDWDRLLSDETGSRGHDVWGVNRYLDPLTGELRECFSPRFHRNGRGRDE